MNSQRFNCLCPPSAGYPLLFFKWKYLFSSTVHYVNCSCFSKDWQLRVFLETQWNLDLDISKMLQLLNFWDLLDNNLCPFFTLRGSQPLGWLECYRLNVKCLSQTCVLYSWSTVLSDIGKLGDQELYEWNRPWGLISREYFIPSIFLYPSLYFLSTRI